MDETKNTNELAAADATEVEADGYYGEEDMDSEELDLSFLDEEDDDEAADTKPESAKTDASK